MSFDINDQEDDEEIEESADPRGFDHREAYDKIVCSEAFQFCPDHDEDGTCLIADARVKCWKVVKCPKGWDRS